MSDPLIELDPPAHAWAELIEFDPTRHAEERSRLGLTTDRPIVMAGHQGGFWHAGIAAKLFAAHAIAKQIGGDVAWLVIDTDDADPTLLRVPFHDEQGKLTERTLRVDRETTEHPRAAEAIAAYEQHAAEPSHEARATRATMDLLPEPTPTLIRSSQLAATATFRSLVARFQTNAPTAREQYNTAITTQPDSGITPLLGDQAPFWRVTPSGGRLPARESDLNGTLWPRALATTGVVRASLCDLFIHGTGGRAYEPINDAWLGNSLAWGLAPYVTATATLRLRFEGETVTEADAAHAAWAAHHARHQPASLGDEDRQAKRNELVQRIADAPRGSAERAELFVELHRVLDAARGSRAEQLRSLAARATALRMKSAERTLRDDRTWPAVLHSSADLEALRDAIAESFACPSGCASDT